MAVTIKKEQILECGMCLVKFTSRKNCKSRAPKYCSKSCYAKSLIINKLKSCEQCGKEFETYKKNQRFCSMDCNATFHTGENSVLWRGGISGDNEKQRKSAKYKQWRDKIFNHDNFTCVICGIRSGCGHRIELHADHIKPFAYFPELRFDINNGRTICKECHKKTDTYGSKAYKHERKAA